MYSVKFHKSFKKALVRCKKRGLNLRLVEEAIDILEETGSLPPSYRPHKLTGDWAGFWECHIRPDWLMVWSQDDNELLLLFITTGSHSDIFG